MPWQEVNHVDDVADSGFSTDLFDGVTREELHVRRIEFRGFQRSDGLFEVEGCLTDRKPMDFQPPSGSRVVRANDPIHDLGVRVVFDSDMVVRAVQTFFRDYPYKDCRDGGDALQAMVGVRIAAGWSSEVRKRLPSSETCTHQKELMIGLATAAVQTMTVKRQHLQDAVDAEGRPLKLGSCYAYGESRDIVLQRWPAFHRPRPDKK